MGIFTHNFTDINIKLREQLVKIQHTYIFAHMHTETGVITLLYGTFVNCYPRYRQYVPIVCLYYGSSEEHPSNKKQQKLYKMGHRYPTRLLLNATLDSHVNIRTSSYKSDNRPLLWEKLFLNYTTKVQFSISKHCIKWITDLFSKNNLLQRFSH